MDKFFSIIIPTRNRPETCAVAVQSAAEQAGSDYEIILVDDGSDDRHGPAYAALQARFGEVLRVHALPKTERGHGPSFARNTGVWVSRSRYLAFLDDDDQWTDPGYLAQARRTIEAVGEPDLHYADQAAFEGERELADDIWLGALARHTGAFRPVGDGAYLVTAEQLVRCATGFCHLNTTIVSRRLFERVRGFDTGLRYEPDRDFALRTVGSANQIVYRPKVVARHNVPDRSRSDNVTTQTSPIEKCINQLYLLDKAICFLKPPLVDYAIEHKGYTLKRMAEIMAAEGDYRTAARYAGEALGLRFSPKWLAYSLYLRSRAMRAPAHVTRAGKWYGTAD
ncbi:MAG TPA: glycosyltransferase family A protein [Acetobacteraceae bacterium]|nr:glycosyltransferase family A protein [Acetobacteraceae bacterium]